MPDEGGSVVTLPFPDAGNCLRAKCTTQCVDQDDRRKNAAIQWSAVMRCNQNLDAGKSATEPEAGEHGVAVQQRGGARRHLAQRK